MVTDPYQFTETEELRHWKEEALRVRDLAIDLSINAIAFIDLNGNLTYTNPSFLKSWGYIQDNEVLGRSIVDFFHDQEGLQDAINQIRKVGNWVGNLKASKKDSSVIDMQTSVSVIKDGSGHPVCMVASFIDINEQNKLTKSLKTQEKVWNSLINNTPNIIMSVDRDGVIQTINRTVSGLTSDKVIGNKIYDFILVDHHPVVKGCLEDVFQDMQPRTYEVLGAGVSGPNSAWYETRVVPIKDGQKVGFLLLISRDITASKQIQEELKILNKQLLRSNKRVKHLVLKDASTGLYNHRYLEDAIEIEFYRARRYHIPLSTLMLDLDYFKSINDTYGHQFGDLVLRQLARLIKRMVRKYDIVIRFGGEEFVIISPGTDRSQALSLAQRILEEVNLYNFGNKDHSVKLKLTFAVTSYPEDRVINGMGLIEMTEKIMNKAKESGGNRAFSSLDIKNGKSLVSKTEKKISDPKILRYKIGKLTREANQGLIEAIFAFAKAIELKDHYTGEHVERTVKYSTEIARALGLDREEVEYIRQASILHDLGKIGISERILCKKTKLTKKEFDEIKKHPQIGADILRPIRFLHSVIPLILHHHARWDGQGYPDSLKGDEIPIGARIVAIADVYQALISDRPYRKALSKSAAIKIIKQGSGTQFDPNIVNVFFKIIKKEK